MRDLSALQAQFGAGLDAPVCAADALEIFLGEPEQVKNRFEIYRGNTMANAVKAIGATYPVIEKMVGAEFFAGLAREYRSRFPSNSGDLNEYGESFAAFLAGFAPAKEIPYLADMARLEWQVHLAHYAADPAPFDPARLASVPPERQLRLRPWLHPACHVLHSDHPIARLWEVHQDAFSGEFEVDFSQGPAHALVFRPRYRVEVARIGEAEAAFLAAALAGGTLETALAAAQSRSAIFDLGRALGKWVESSVIVDLKLNGG